MNGRDSIQSLLALRKLTRAITDVVRVQMTEYLKTLTPLLRPKAVLGDYVQGGLKEPSRKADKAFGDLQALYETVAVAKPYNLPRELSPPLSFTSVGLEITPLDYYHVAQSGADTRKIKVRCPLTWVLTYTDFPPTRLQELLDTKARSVEEPVDHLRDDHQRSRASEGEYLELVDDRQPQCRQFRCRPPFGRRVAGRLAAWERGCHRQQRLHHRQLAERHRGQGSLGRALLCRHGRSSSPSILGRHRPGIHTRRSNP